MQNNHHSPARDAMWRHGCQEARGGAPSHYGRKGGTAMAASPLAAALNRRGLVLYYIQPTIWRGWGGWGGERGRQRRGGGERDAM